jgi:hypothetical protein
MPLDPLILMIFGVALILAAAFWYKPRVGIGRGKTTGGGMHGTTTRTRGVHGSDGAKAAGSIGVRDWIGWLIGLFGMAVAAYGLYLQVFAP